MLINCDRLSAAMGGTVVRPLTEPGAVGRARRRGDCGGKIHVDAQRGGLRHDVSDLTLEAIEESCAFGEDCVLIGLR